MKKIALIIGFIGSTALNIAHAEDKSFTMFEEENPKQEEIVYYQTMETDPGSPGDNTSPINQYLPLLLISGAALALYFGKRNRKITD